MLLFVSTNSVYGQVQPTLTVTPSGTSNPPAQQEIDNIPDIYREVLETSKSAVEEIHTTADKLLSLVGLLFTALTVSGLGAAALLTWYGQRASDRATAAQQKAAEAFDTIQRIEMKASDLEKRNNLVLASTDELTQKQDYLRTQIVAAEKLLQTLQAEISRLKSGGEKDRQVLKKPLTLVQIDDYGMQLLSGAPSEKDSAISVLLELSTRTDAVIRRRAIKALGVLESYDERVAKRLQEVISSDSAEGVRKEAEKSLRFIEAKRNKKTAKRKP
jgi:hypothetical protein